MVEEVLRFECPVQAFGRIAAAEVEIDGMTIPAGSSITLVIGAAHRDSLHFENADHNAKPEALEGAAVKIREELAKAGYADESRV